MTPNYCNNTLKKASLYILYSHIQIVNFESGVFKRSVTLLTQVSGGIFHFHCFCGRPIFGILKTSVHHVKKTM